MRLRYTRDFHLAVGVITAMTVIPISAYFLLDGQAIYVFILAMFGFLSSLIPALEIFEERRLHAMMPDGYSDLPLMPTQPDPQNAPHVGDKLVIAHQPIAQEDTPPNNGFIMLFLIVGLEFIFLVLSPHLRTHLLTFVTFSPHQLALTLVQWIILIYPIIFGVVSIFGLSSYRHVNRREVITADDQGVVIQFPRRQPQTIRWHEIRLFASTGDRYFLLGPEQSLLFTLAHIDDDAVTDSKMAQFKNDANCLVATITMRTGLPQRTGAVYLHPVNVATFYTGEEMASFPLTTTSWQPLEPEITPTEKQSMLPPELQASIPSIMLFGWSLRWSLLVLIGFPLFAVLFNSGNRSSFSDIINITIIFWMISIAIIMLNRFQYLSNQNPSVLAQKDKLVIRGYNKKVIASIDWEDIAAWGVVPPFSGMPDKASYAVVSRDGEEGVWWFEPSNKTNNGLFVAPNSRDNYRMIAEQLHAYIAQRTGLELHEIPNGRER